MSDRSRFSLFWKRFLGLVIVGLLTACAQFPTGQVVTSHEHFRGLLPLVQFRLNGRLSVKTETQSLAGGVTWRREAAEEVVLLSGPLGQGAVEIRRQEGGLVLVGADGSITRAASDELLLEQALGLRLPLDGLVYWLSGLPRPGEPFAATLDAAGRVASLEQNGWRLEYDRYRQVDGRALPGRLFARRGEALEFRLVVDAWEAR